jgi:hypothetical protein
MTNGVNGKRGSRNRVVVGGKISKNRKNSRRTVAAKEEENIKESKAVVEPYLAICIEFQLSAINR